MTEKSRSSSIQYIYPLRSQSCHDCRDKVTRTASDLHRHTVDRAQRRFERQLANSERELRSAMKQRRDHSSSAAEKRQATQNLEHLRSTLNNDYSQLIQAYVHEHKEKVDEVEKYMHTQRYDEERHFDKHKSEKKLKEALQETQLQSEKMRLQSINQIIRERDAVCEEKLAAQKSLYTRLLDEQARRLRAEQALQTNMTSVPTEHLDMAQLKGRLTRVEYEHREIKQLILDMRTDLAALIIQQPTYKNAVHIRDFPVKP
ncbi:unnamed protein product [Adineta steineri]|uniref:Uncharacterized protein n=1 Tax=Adineta steineri TaxID=433720 RepID=A0A815NSI3_9BILA|nr:unnamed protein product [Adineta steineri]